MRTPVVTPQNRPTVPTAPDTFIVGIERPMVVRPDTSKPIERMS